MFPPPHLFYRNNSTIERTTTTNTTSTSTYQLANLVVVLVDPLANLSLRPNGRHLAPIQTVGRVLMNGIGVVGQLVGGVEELFGELAAEVDVLPEVAARINLAPAGGYGRLGAGARNRVRDGRRDEGLDEGGLLEAARH